eukprot:12886218-Prorocentrum_lima.AAC.1
MTIGSPQHSTEDGSSAAHAASGSTRRGSFGRPTVFGLFRAAASYRPLGAGMRVPRRPNCCWPNGRP